MTFISLEGDPIEEVGLLSEFQVEFRFRCDNPQALNSRAAHVRLVTYHNQKPAIAWDGPGMAELENDDIYVVKAKLRSPPEASRQFFVQVKFGDSNVVIEKKIEIRKPGS